MANWDVDKACPLIHSLIVWSRARSNTQTAVTDTQPVTLYLQLELWTQNFLHFPSEKGNWTTARGDRSHGLRQRWLWALTVKLQLLPGSQHLGRTGGLMYCCVCPNDPPPRPHPPESSIPRATSVIRGHVPRSTSGLMLNSAAAAEEPVGTR